MMFLPVALGLSLSPSSVEGKNGTETVWELLYSHGVHILNMTETHDIGNANQGNLSSDFKIENIFLTSLELPDPTANKDIFSPYFCKLQKS